MRKFTAELLIATAVHSLFLAWYFRAPLLHGQVDNLQQESTLAAPQALDNMSEMPREVLSAITVQTREIKAGIFPSWSPYAQGGTPLIGKMQNGVFAPYHILLYLLPIRWLPLGFTLLIALKSYLTFIFTYLFVRSLRLNMWSGILAGTLYVAPVIQGGIFSWFGPGAYLPLLLLLAESYCQGYRKLAMFLWPWAVALPFFSGHFESACWINFSTGIYLLLHLRADSSIPFTEKLKRFTQIAGLSSLGGLIAAIQIYPAFEYVQLSYNRIWHTFDSFGWEYETISKHLSAEDAPMLALGFLGLGAFYGVFKRAMARQGESAGGAGLKIAACALLAFTIACFANLGLDDSLRALSYDWSSETIVIWLLGASMAVFAFWTWRQENQARGINILGWIMVGGMLLGMKAPLVANLLPHLPLTEHFHNGLTHRWDYTLAASVLCAASLERFKNLPPAWSDRGRTALRAFEVLCIFILGYALSQPLKGTLLRLVPSGTPPPLAGQPAPPGGIMGPERALTYHSSYMIAGWIPSFPTPSAVMIGAIPEGANSVPAGETAQARLEPANERLYFHAELPMGEFRKQGQTRVFAKVQYPDGNSRYLMGPTLWARNRGGSRAASLLIPLFVLALPVVFIIGTAGQRAAYLLFFVLVCTPWKSASIAADRIPYPVPGLDKLKNESDIFRVSSIAGNFFPPDYASMYGFSDLRYGDNVDLLPLVYFQRDLALTLLMGSAPREIALGSRLWGLANVKYLVDFPNARLPGTGFDLFYKGADISIWRNKYFKPRAGFYDRYVYVPVKDMRDWNRHGRFLESIREKIGDGFDWDRTLILHDLPKTDSSPVPTASSVKIDEYLTDQVRLTAKADHPGFVFLSDNLFPGWRAFVNGVRAPLLRSWITFRAVEVPAGESKVVFVYEPVLLWMILSLVACVGAAWVFLYGEYRRTRPPLETVVLQSQSPKKKKNAAPDEAGAELADCMAWTERLFASYIGMTLLFWLLWSAFIYHGGPFVPWTARALLAGFIFYAAYPKFRPLILSLYTR